MGYVEQLFMKYAVLEHSLAAVMCGGGADHFKTILDSCFINSTAFSEDKV